MLLAQANCLALVGAAFGLIAGIITGQRSWSLVTDSTAVVDQFVLPVPELIAITAGSIAAASLIGIAAAHSMRQIRTADGATHRLMSRPSCVRRLGRSPDRVTDRAVNSGVVSQHTPANQVSRARLRPRRRRAGRASRTALFRAS